jgi:hypothetical protein
MAKKTLHKKTQATSIKKGGKGKVVFVLAHGAGHHPQGCKHKDVQAWAKALRAHGDVVDSLKYGKPYNLMGNLCTAHAAVVKKAASSKAKSVVLVGLGMGARVAVHMMGKTPGDDGKALPEISNDLLKSVKGMVAINYPLLRVGSREVRSKPLLALGKGAPKMLFVVGPKDPHVDAGKLEAVRKKMKAKTGVTVLPAGESEKPADRKAVVQHIAQFLAR